MAKEKILICDDQPDILEVLGEALRAENYEVITVNSGGRALEFIPKEKPDLLMLDLQMPGLTGMQVLQKIKEEGLDIPAIVMTAFGTSSTAIEAIKAGAFDYVTKPFDFPAMFVSIKRALEHKFLEAEVKQLRSELGLKYKADPLIGNTSVMQEIYKNIGRVAPTDAPVLITGESGTGKELVANAIYEHSLRKDKPFVKVNCAAIPETLLESELFGHEKGSFTGAITRTKGRFEAADEGTIFMDEIAEMSPALQAKILRIIQNKTFERVGGEETIGIDIRVLASTNKQLVSEVQAGKFREDLYYRLNVINIHLPPLRERKADIPLLVEHFLQLYGNRFSEKKIGISKEVLKKFMEYDWPGNVRELENVVYRAAVLAEDGFIRPVNIPFYSEVLKHEAEGISSSDIKISEEFLAQTPLKKAVEILEKKMIIYALQSKQYNKTQVAKTLGVNRRLLFTKIKKYNLLPKKK